MPLRTLLLKDFWLKLFSLALAILIWATVSFAIRRERTPGAVSSNRLTTREFRVPVLVMGATADVRECRVNPGEVVVMVRGEAKELSRLQEKDIHAIVDLTGIESARSLRKRIEISTPPGITYLDVFPTNVEVYVPHKR